MLPFPEVDQRIEVIHIVDIGMINDAANPIMLHRAHLPTFTGEGPSILAEPIERKSVSIDIDMGSKRVEPITTTCNERATGTSIPASTLASTSAPVTTSTLPLA